MTRLLAIVFGLLLALPASAQRKRWTWVPPNQADNVAHHIIAATSSSSGNSPVIYAEVSFDGENLTGIAIKAALVSAGGKTLQVVNVPAPTHYAVESLFTPAGAARWKAIAISNTSAIYSDGEHVVRFRLKGGIATVLVESIGPVEEEELLPIPGGGVALASYLKVKKQFVGSVQWDFGSPPLRFYRLSSVELWAAN